MMRANSILNRQRRGAAAFGATFLLGAVLAAVGARTATADLPNPCALIPAKTIASAFGAKTAPTSTNAATPDTSTCTYGNAKLTVEVGTRALTYPAPPLKTVKLPQLPHGLYYTYAHTTRSQIVFYEGTAAAGTYAVVSNFAKISETKLVKVALALNKALTGG